MPTSIRSSEEPPQQQDSYPFMDIYNQLHTINSDESRAHNVNKKLGDTNEKPASQTRKHHGNSRPRKPRKLKLEDDEEEIIKMQERLEFQKVLDNQIKAIDPELIQPLPECMNKYKIECPDDSCASSMLILLQYQSFKSFVDYSEDEEKQNEQVQAQKQDRFLLMKKKRAIRREKRKSFKMKRSLASTNRIMQQPMIIGPVLFLSPNMASNAMTYSNEIMQPSFTGPMMNPMNPMMSTCMSTTESDCTNYSEDSLGEEEWSNDFDDDQENEEEDPSRMQYEQRGYEPEYKRFKYSAPDEVQCSYGSVSQSGPASTASSSSVSSRNFDTLFDNMVQQPCCVPQANLPPSHRQASVLTMHSVSSEQEYTMSNLVPSCDTIATPMRCGESPFIPSNTILQPPPQIWYQSPAMEIPTDDYRLAPNAAVRQPTNLGVCSVNNFNIYPQ